MKPYNLLIKYAACQFETYCLSAQKHQIWYQFTVWSVC